MPRPNYWPDDTSVPPSVAHKGDMNHFGVEKHPDGLVPWTAGRAPDLTCGHNMYTTGRLRSCGYCGSAHPSDLAAAIRAGAKVSWADFKYGWPHKVYVEGWPNPYEGMPNSIHSMGYGAKGEMGERERAYIDEHGGPSAWVQLRSTMDDEKKEEFVKYSWHHVGQEGKTIHAKFYSVHLQDASPEDYEVISKALGLYMTFVDGKVQWQPWYPKAAS